MQLSLFQKFVFYLAVKYLKNFLKGLRYSSFVNTIWLFLCRSSLSIVDKEFIAFNKKNWTDQIKGNGKDGVILADLFSVEDMWPPYAMTIDYYCKKYDLKLQGYVFGNTRVSPRAYNVYRSFNAHFELLRIPFPFSWSLIKETWSELSRIKTKSDLVDYEYQGINIGIDIYESYLRELNRETVDFNDHRLYFYFYLGLAIAQYWQRFIDCHKVKVILTSHDNYIWFNILCKLGYKNKITVILPHPMRLTQLTHPFSMFDKFQDYSRTFSSFSEEEQLKGRTIGKEILDSRFSGKLGPETYYMNKSMYGDHTEVEIPELSDNSAPKVIIATHCFFDNPHAYNRILFPDFWEWLVFLGELSKKVNYKWFIKVHPDPTPGTEFVLVKFLKMYPHFHLLPDKIPHSQVVKADFMALLTCYGTIGEEYPLFGVPVINAGYNPRISYDFNYSPKTIEEYANLLLRLPEIKKNFSIDVQKVYEFIYMHRRVSQESDLFYSSYLTLLQTRQGREGHMLSDFISTFDEAKKRSIKNELDKVKLF